MNDFFVYFVAENYDALNLIKKDFLWGYAFLLVGLAYVSGLFVDLTGDSGLYATISRQMVDSGDWFNLQINGKPYDQKPHLFFWLAGCGISLFGNTNFAFKLFPFLYGILGIYFVYHLGKTIYGKKAGKLAALIVGTSQITFLYFFDFHMDSILQSGVTLALWQLAEYFKGKRWINFIFSFVGVGLAMFSKGPIGAVIPFFAGLFYLISERDFKQLHNLKWLLGIVIAFTIISPTLIHLYKSFGVEGLKFFFITNNFGRITGEYAGSNSDPFFYLHTILWAFLPWTIFVVLGVYSEIRNWFKKSISNSWSYYLLGSTFVLLLVLSIAKGKAPNYFLIAVAPISVVVGKWLSKTEDLSSNTRKYLVIAQWICVGVLAVFLLVLTFTIDKRIVLPIVSIGVSIFLIFVTIYTNGINWRTTVFISVVVISTLNLVLNTAILPQLYEYQAARRVLEIYNENRKPNDNLYNYHSEDYELFFYADHEVTQIQNSDDYKEMLEDEGTWLHTIKNGYDELIGYEYGIDTVYFIPYKGMNQLDLKFLNLKTREANLDTTYLIRID